jgi:hypothetical protein
MPDFDHYFCTITYTKMKSWLPLIILQTFSILAFCQEENTFILDQIPIEQIRPLEKRLNSKELTIGLKMTIPPDFFPGAATLDLEQPLMFIRPQPAAIGNVEVEYFYTKNDNKLRLIVYNWNSNGDYTGLHFKDIESWIGTYEKKFAELLNYLSAKLGNFKEGSDKFLTEPLPSGGHSKKATARWNAARCNAEVNAVWSPIKEKEGGLTVIPICKIQVKIYWN